MICLPVVVLKYLPDIISGNSFASDFEKTIKMDDNIIALYENKTLIVQTTSIVFNGQLNVVDPSNPDNILFKQNIFNTDFVRVKVDLPTGKLQVQIIINEKKIYRNIVVYE